MTVGAKKYHKRKLYDLSLTELSLDPAQPRKYFDGQALSELSTSIAKHGVLLPLLARLSGDGSLVVVSGERRYQASLLAGLTSVPVLITDGDPVEVSIVENLLRENLTAVEEAEAIERLRNEHNYQLADLSSVLGKAPSTLSEILSINRLPESVKDDCRKDPRAARYVLAEIAKQRDGAKMATLYQKYKESGLTRGEIRHKVRLPRADGGSPPKDLSFLGVCLRKLQTLEVERLDQPQIVKLAEELDKLGLAVQTRLVALRSAGTVKG